MRALTRLTTVLTVFVGLTFVQLPSMHAREVPRTLADRQAVGVDPVLPPFPIDYLGVLWDTHGTAEDHADEGAEEHGAVRFRVDGAWTAWQPLTEDGAEAEGQWASGLVPGGDAEAYQVRGLPADAVAPRAIALNTTDGPREVVGRAAGGAHAVANCLSRADWGADESLRFDASGAEVWPAEFSPVQTLTVHHTATANDDPTPDATVRAIYRYHAVERGWGDIGYQYLVDEQGRVYEGRWSGAPSATCAGGGTGADFAHDDAGNLVTGAHVGGYNTGNLGASLLGNFSPASAGGTEPSPVAVDALEALLAELATRHSLDPHATVDYFNPVNGNRKTVNMIGGHRDWAATECPGEQLYDNLPAIRDAVAAQKGTVTQPDTGVGTEPTVVEARVSAKANDAEERPNGAVRLGDGDLEMAKDGSYQQTVGLRFTGVSVPAGATITRAYVQFTADEVKTGTAGLIVQGQAADDAGAFTTASKNISLRPRTAASVAWTAQPWPKVGARTTAEQTPDLSPVVQEIVSRPGWAGNTLVLVVTGTGTRTAESFEGGSAKAAVLHVEYTTP